MTLDPPSSSYECRVVGLEQLTYDTRRLRLRITGDRPFRFEAGQYVQLSFAALAPTDYSIASRPDQRELEFFIRNMRADGVSGYVTEALKVGDSVRLEGPFGSCCVDPAHQGPILAIGGGSGLAPMKSIVETALARRLPQPIYLYFGVRTPEDLFLVADLERLAAQHENFTFVAVVEQPGPTNRCRQGRLDQVIAEDFGNLEGFMAYLAGSPAMVEATNAALQRLGLADSAIHADAYHSMAVKAQTDAAARA